MRTEKELWEVVLAHQEYFDTTLGYWIRELRWEGILKVKECHVLFRVIESLIASYWNYKEGEIEPHIDWINNRIKELS